MIPWLDQNSPFPDVDTALTAQEGLAGLLAAGADLSPQRLLDAYRQGIFPWYSDDQPILWWSTDPRMVLFLDNFKLSKSLKKTLRKLQKDDSIEFVFDKSFQSVMQNCAMPRANPGEANSGTWITDDIILAYTKLHQLGFAHSSEMWVNGELVAGAYGVCIGKMFYGESMFSRVTDGSKMALAHLVHFLRMHDVKLIDCQQETGHLASLGATPIPRVEFIRWIQQATKLPPILEWKTCGAGV